MPYELSAPPAIIKNLPKGAQRIWITTFNSVAKDSTEASARVAAWAQVKQRYVKQADGKWVRKPVKRT